MIAVFVCARRRRCRKIRTFQLDMGWYYPAGEERNGYRRLRPFFRLLCHRRALENGRDNSYADTETLRRR